MNYYLELSQINEYFRQVSSLEAERLSAAEYIDLEFAPLHQMVRNLIMTEIPEYYLNESSEEELSCEGIVNEVQKRGYLCRWRQRDGISKVKVDIEGEQFVIDSDYKGGWSLIYGAFHFNTKMEGYELKDMSVTTLVDMMEDIVSVPDSIERLYKMYLDMISAVNGKKHLQNAELTAQALFQAKQVLSEVRLFQTDTIEYTCYGSGILLLTPFGRRGAIIGFMDYTKMAALEDTVSRILSYKEGSTLPDGFVLYE